VGARAGRPVHLRAWKFLEALTDDLLRYARAQFALSDVENGVTIRKHLEQVERQTGAVIPDLHPDPPPPEVDHLWRWFNDLHNTRGGGFGPQAISYAEIDAWARLTGSSPTPWEVSVLRRLDVAYLNHLAEKGG
jgi:hypothetical protein